MKNTDFDKIRIHLRGWLQGRAEGDPEYYIPLYALNFIESNGYHQGFRKDGVTPAFQHQLEITQYLRTQCRNLKHAALTLAAAILHDVMEDHDVEHSTLVELAGKQVADAVWLLTKKFKGVTKSVLQYFRDLATCPIASAVKGADRANNLQSMLGVFTLEKQRQYANEAVKWFLPMLKKARRAFPEQEPFYENIKLVLNSQLELLAAIHASAK